MTWPDDASLLQSWPQLGRIDARETAGRGLRLATAIGPVHLRQRVPERLPMELAAGDALGARGIRVSDPLPTADGGRFLGHDGWSLICYPELPGRAYGQEYWSADVLDWMPRVGRAVAQVTAALAGVDVEPLLALGLEVRPASPSIHGLPRQLTHRDLHTGNLVLSDELGPGVIDLDHFELGPALVDLAYCGVTPLASTLTQADERGIAQDEAVAHWHEVWRALLSGYEELRPLTDAERAAVAPLMVDIEHDFASWFARCQDEPNRALSLRMAAIVTDTPPPV